MAPFHQRHRRTPPLLSTPRLLLAWCAAWITLCLYPGPGAAAPPLAAEPDPDPLDVLVDGSLSANEPPPGSFTVGVEALLHLSAEDRTTFGAFAFLQVPLGRFAAPPRRALAASPALDEPLDTTPAEPARDEPAAEAAPAAAVVLVSPEVARGAVRAACRAAKLDEADRRLDGFASRARTSALLPELRLRATRAVDESESLSPTEYDPLRRTASGGTSTWFEARATFRLDRLVFIDDELTVERLRIARAAERSKLVARVLDLLAAWQRARTTESDPAATPDARTRATLAAAASETALDVLTGGWFSRAIRARGEGAATATAAPRSTGSSSEPAAGNTAERRSATGAARPPEGGKPEGEKPSDLAHERATHDANDRTRDANSGPRPPPRQDAGAADATLDEADTSHDAARPSSIERASARRK